jgi:hypothetical protein
MPHLRIREIMDELNASGLTADQSALVTELVAVCFMASMGGKPGTPRQDDDYESMFPSKEARRAFEYRQRKRDASVTMRDESVTNVTVPSPSPPYDNKNSSTPLNPIPNSPTPQKREERAKRLPEDWQPSESLLSSRPIQKLGLPREVLIFETEAFRDHWLGNGRRMIDWNRTFMNWMREAVRRRTRFEPKKGNVVAGSFRKELPPEPPRAPRTPEEQAEIDAKLKKLIRIKGP